MDHGKTRQEKGGTGGGSRWSGPRVLAGDERRGRGQGWKREDCQDFVGAFHTQKVVERTIL